MNQSFPEYDVPPIERDIDTVQNLIIAYGGNVEIIEKKIVELDLTYKDMMIGLLRSWGFDKDVWTTQQAVRN